MGKTKEHFIEVGWQKIGDVVSFVLNGRRTMGYVARKGGPIKIHPELVKEVRVNGKREWKRT